MIFIYITEQQIQRNNGKKITQKLLDWYQLHKRDLPWRKTSDPYKIWVSEVMLQQTRVETVIPYWEKFLKRFPTLQKLAEADAEVVLKHWEGLGYYSRARHLQAAVREVVASYDGIVPDSPAVFSKLPGVGPYTTGAVLSIAYNQELPAVDGNVFRVLSRLFRIEEDISRPRTRTLFESLASSLLPSGFAGDFNQALMELGATICIPKCPKCGSCPVRQECKANEEGMQEDFPVKGKRIQPRPVEMYALLIEDGHGKWGMRRRPENGLLANMWEFPTWSKSEASIEEYLLQLGLGTASVSNRLEHIAEVDHIFTHLHWKIQVHRGIVQQHAMDFLRGEQEIDQGELKWFSITEMDRLSLSTAHQKIKRLIDGLV